MDISRFLSYNDFLRKYSVPDSLYESAVKLYFNIMEGVSTDDAMEKLRSSVGQNKLETDGKGIFDLSSEAGYSEGDQNSQQQIDDAIDSGLNNGSLDDFGTALSPEMPPTEGDFGLDQASTGGDDFGLDTVGVDESTPADETGADMPPEEGSEDITGLDDVGLDEMVPDDASMPADDSQMVGESVEFPRKADHAGAGISEWKKSWASIIINRMESNSAPGSNDVAYQYADSELSDIVESNPSRSSNSNSIESDIREFIRHLPESKDLHGDLKKVHAMELKYITCA